MYSAYALLIVAAIGGIAVAVQAQFMGQIDKQVGTLGNLFITYGGGGLMIGMVMLFHRDVNLAAWSTLPPYVLLLSGALGLVIVGTIGYCTPRIGLVTTLTIVVAAQFIVGALVDHLGGFGAAIRPLDLTRFLGIGLMLVGTWLIVR